jgi:hypothetical protein
MVTVATCGICPYLNMPDRESAPAPQPDPRFTSACTHRGDALAQGVCNACGMKSRPFTIYGRPPRPPYDPQIPQ